MSLCAVGMRYCQQKINVRYNGKDIDWYLNKHYFVSQFSKIIFLARISLNFFDQDELRPENTRKLCMDSLKSYEDLKNKPLVEAYVEIRWRLQKQGLAQSFDYQILLGGLRSQIEGKFPYHEPLPSINIPDEMAGHTVQHRFRTQEDGWPVIQVGPGIFTFNETTKYKWSSFKTDVLEAVEYYYSAYPKKEELEPVSIFLRYIDAIQFDHTREDVRQFLRDKLKVGIALPDGLFESGHIEHKPRSLKFEVSFPCDKPKGQAVVLFATGSSNKDGKEYPSIIWHTTVQSTGNDVPIIPRGLENWLDSAHEITHDWFVKFSKGDLLRSFESE